MPGASIQLFLHRSLSSFCIPLLLSILLWSQNGFSQPEIKIREYDPLLTSSVQKKDFAKASFYSFEIARLYRQQKQLQKAIDYFNQCQGHAKKINDNNMVYAVHETLGTIFTELQNHKKALDNFQSALKVAQQLNKPFFVFESHINIAHVQEKSGRYKRAIESTEKALTVASAQNDVALQHTCYLLLADYHNRNGDKIKANEYTDLSRVNELKLEANRAGIEKEATQTELKKQAERLKKTEESLRETEAIKEKQQLEIDLLNKRKEVADLKIKEQNAHIKNEELLRNSIIVVALLAGALVAVLISGYKKKLKINQKIDLQNKNIKSSINYAKRIQEAMLPKKDLHQNLGNDSFIFFKPRDTVSGDFYWCSKIKNGQGFSDHDIAFAAVDCTGHGVPGAFMSMIGINALNGIVGRGITETNQILDALHVEIRTALKQEVTGNNDGMDVALCVYRKDKKQLEFSGAKNPLVYIQGNELFRIKGDVHPIGGSKNKPQLAFKKHAIMIDKPTMIYLFTDGYRDQFGGKENTKFMSKRFNELLLDIYQLPIEQQMRILENTINEWKGGVDQTDDILVMGIRLG